MDIPFSEHVLTYTWDRQTHTAHPLLCQELYRFITESAPATYRLDDRCSIEINRGEPIWLCYHGIRVQQISEPDLPTLYALCVAILKETG
jgi:hypothetical protein